MKRTCLDSPMQRGAPQPFTIPPVQPADVTILIGKNITSAVTYRRAADDAGVDLELVIPQWGRQGAFAALSDLHRRGRLGRYFVLDAHGMVGDQEHHFVSFPEGGLPTLPLLRHVRDPRRNGSRYEQTLIHLHTCRGARLREPLKEEAGAHLICGGKGGVFAKVGVETIVAILRMIGTWKRDPRMPYPTPKQFWTYASEIMGDTVSLVGKEVGCHVQYAKSPEQLAGASDYKKWAALARRIRDGKVAQARALLQAFPEIGKTDSLLTVADASGNLSMIECLIRHGTRCDLHHLVRFGVQYPSLLHELDLTLRGRVAERLCSGIAGKQGRDDPQENIEAYRRALDCGYDLVIGMLAGVPKLPMNDGLLAICGDPDVSLEPYPAVLRHFVDRLTAYVCEHAGWSVEAVSSLRDDLALKCCMALVRRPSPVPLLRGYLQCLLHGNMQGFRLILRQVRNLMETRSVADAARWLESPGALAVQQLVSALNLRDHDQVVRGMLFCLNRERYPLQSMAAVRETILDTWNASVRAVEPQGDFDAWMAAVCSDVHALLSSLLPRDQRLAYLDVLRLSLSGPGPSPVDFLAELLNRRPQDAAHAPTMDARPVASVAASPSC